MADSGGIVVTGDPGLSPDQVRQTRWAVRRAAEG
jgi:hypothetical protein